VFNKTLNIVIIQPQREHYIVTSLANRYHLMTYSHAYKVVPSGEMQSWNCRQDFPNAHLAGRPTREMHIWRDSRLVKFTLGMYQRPLNQHNGPFKQTNHNVGLVTHRYWKVDTGQEATVTSLNLSSEHTEKNVYHLNNTHIFELIFRNRY